MQQRITPKFLSSGEHKKKLFVGYGTSGCAFGFFGLIRFGLYSYRFIRFLYFGLYGFIHRYGSVSVVTVCFRFGFGNNQINQSCHEFLNGQQIFFVT